MTSVFDLVTLTANSASVVFLMQWSGHKTWVKLYWTSHVDSHSFPTIHILEYHSGKLKWHFIIQFSILAWDFEIVLHIYFATCIFTVNDEGQNSQIYDFQSIWIWYKEHTNIIKYVLSLPLSPTLTKCSYVNLFESHFRIFHLYENTDVTIASEGLKNSCISSALVTFENGGMFIVPCLLLHGISIYRSYQLSRLLRHVKNTEELYILTEIPKSIVVKNWNCL